MSNKFHCRWFSITSKLIHHFQFHKFIVPRCEFVYKMLLNSDIVWWHYIFFSQILLTNQQKKVWLPDNPSDIHILWAAVIPKSFLISPFQVVCFSITVLSLTLTLTVQKFTYPTGREFYWKINLAVSRRWLIWFKISVCVDSPFLLRRCNRQFTGL